MTPPDLSPELREAVKELFAWVPGELPETVDRSEECGMYQPEDEGAPFFTETYLYNTLGKDLARSLLARAERVCQLLTGRSVDDIIA